MNSEIKEFLFKEYDFAYNTLKNLTEVTDRWFRFYIVMISAVGSGLAYLYASDKIPKNDSIFFTIAGLFLVVLFLAGFLVLSIEFRIRIRTVECLNAINRIRRYFIDKFIKDDYRYLLFPHTDTQRVFERENAFKAINMICLIIIIINTIIGFAGIFLLLKSFNICLNMLPQLIVVMVVLFVIQVVLLLGVYKCNKQYKYEQSGQYKYVNQPKYGPEFPEDWRSSQKAKKQEGINNKETS